MNLNPLSVRVLTALLTFAPLTLAPGLAAQDAPAREQRGLPPPTPTVNVKFPGGTLADLVDLLRSQDEMVNIVVPELAAKVPVPAMQLRAVTPESALRAASTVIEKQFDLNVQTINQRGAGSVLALRVQERTSRTLVGGGQVAQGDETRVEVFSLRAIVTPGEPGGVGLRTATVLTAIDTGLGFVPSGSKPILKFHEDSGLLFVSATIEQLQIVHSVLSQLRQSVAQPRDDDARRAPNKDAGEEKAEPKKQGK